MFREDKIKRPGPGQCRSRAAAILSAIGIRLLQLKNPGDRLLHKVVTQNLRNLAAQHQGVVAGSLPDERPVNAKLFVHKNISQPYDIWPWN